jgi:GAF domain-containing protein
MSTQEILNSIQDILNSKKDLSEKLHEVCKTLKKNIAHYDWVGFYFANHKDKTLHLGPYEGEPTDHKVIPFGKGICGQVAESNQTFLVEDVNAQDNYIACSINVKSEIVVPLLIDEKNIGQIDIDSNTPNAFSAEDEELLKSINASIAEIIKTSQNPDEELELFF